MKVCLLAEGSYPYVVGGVSSWLNTLVGNITDVDFVIQTIVASREDSGKFKYDMPSNVKLISETFLEDQDIMKFSRRRRKKLPPDVARSLRSIVLNAEPEWAPLFHYFATENISANDILMGPDFYHTVEEYYYQFNDRAVFSDFIWTFRSMYLPLFLVLKTKLPQADIYHTISTGYAGILACMGKELYKKPMILTEHGIYTREREEEIIQASWTKGIYKDIWIQQFYKLSNAAYAYSDKVISLFDESRDLQIEIGCEATKTEVIANGINYDALQGLPQKDPDDEYINIGAVLRVSPIKDVKTLINAFSYAKQEVPNLRLYIMGPTDENVEYYNECVSLVESLALQDCIFTGRINIRDYLGKMDMVILTSISEGQPLSMIEAMAAGKPCIATRVGNCEGILLGQPELFDPAGIVTPVMNIAKITQAMVTLAKDPELRARMGEAGRQRAFKLYQQQGYLNRYRDLFKEYYVRGIDF